MDAGLIFVTVVAVVVAVACGVRVALNRRTRDVVWDNESCRQPTSRE